MTPAAQARIMRDGHLCAHCATPIRKKAELCRPCFDAARRTGREPEVLPVDPPRDTTGYVVVGGWACRDERAAATMRAVFAGRLADVPSRAAFTPGPDPADEDERRERENAERRESYARTMARRRGSLAGRLEAWT